MSTSAEIGAYRPTLVHETNLQIRKVQVAMVTGLITLGTTTAIACAWAAFRSSGHYWQGGDGFVVMVGCRVLGDETRKAKSEIKLSRPLKPNFRRVVKWEGQSKNVIHVSEKRMRKNG